ncbi:hypothetical protein WJX72_010504 [[Myrmecia] bisecta]|uniref:Bestrophin n=1 Tax=[Myrmecia] bisecta TaxID=41462 RepID=A0AAW1P2X8_9CHLO
MPADELQQPLNPAGPATNGPQAHARMDRSSSTFRTLITALSKLRKGGHYKGGEGVLNIVRIRESGRSCTGHPGSKYWFYSLCAIRGRPLPIMPMLIYIAYCVLVVELLIHKVPGYGDIIELKALIVPVQTLGLSLFLLLAFRTNSSYDRWWEGRKLWDGIASKSQDLGRMAVGWVAPKDKQLASEIIRWSIAFPVVAKSVLRGHGDLSELVSILPAHEIAALTKMGNRQSMVALKLTRLIQKASVHLTPAITNSMDNSVRGLLADVNSCMRIFQTSIPLAYIVHLRAFLVLWLGLLPFIFVSSMRHWAILVCAVIGYELLGFEDIGVEIEAPFGVDYNDLPLDQITSDLFTSLLEYLDELNQDED